MRKIIKFILKTFIILVTVGIIACAGVNFYIIKSSERKMYTTESISALPADVDCIIVLGAGVRPDGSPSHMLRDRLLTAIELYNAGHCQKLLLSGDHGTEYYDEVNSMKKFVLDNGVTAENVYLDHAGFSTYDTMYRAKELFGIKKAIVVTQKYHLYRAVYVGNALGIDCYGVNSDQNRYVGQNYRDFREMLARFKDFFSVTIKPKPKYLGEKLDINTVPASHTYD